MFVLSKFTAAAAAAAARDRLGRTRIMSEPELDLKKVGQQHSIEQIIDRKRNSFFLRITTILKRNNLPEA